MSNKPKFVSVNMVDKFVQTEVDKGRDWSWDGWTVNIFTPHARARTHVRGSYHNGQWGFMSRVTPTVKGFWVFQRKFLEPVK